MEYMLKFDHRNNFNFPCILFLLIVIMSFNAVMIHERWFSISSILFSNTSYPFPCKWQIGLLSTKQVSISALWETRGDKTDTRSKLISRVSGAFLIVFGGKIGSKDTWKLL